MEKNKKEIILKISNLIKKISKKEINIMEFCGTHTHEIMKNGLKQLLPENINLLSGPGCPVCVTSQEDIDYIIKVSLEENFQIITFGDLVNVKGSEMSLNDLRIMGREVHIVYNPFEAINISMENKEKNYILIGIGFETTAPNLGYTIIKSKELGIKNLFYYSLNKLTPPAMKAILKMGEVKLNGIIGPGHVSTIIGKKGWMDVFQEYKIPFVISGFEPIDIIYGIYLLVNMIEKGDADVLNAYKRSVKEEGNKTAKEILNKVFKVENANWRGLGILEKSGLYLKDEFENFEIRNYFKYEIKSKKVLGCRCDEVIRGVIKPNECSLFKKVCNPQNPVGPCMVSSEGACSAYFLYGDN
ncbi:MAG: hydrogenase formation protein HypD [Caldisericia bacterium]|nr:hydrogenase formation protein HypD [Caldisericia bacterium]